MTCKDCVHNKACNQWVAKEMKYLESVDGFICDYFQYKLEWVHLPCKVGDTIYFDTYRCGESIGVQPHKVAKVEVIVSTERQFGSVGAEIPDWAFGKTVFLTREEAEKALKERM